MTMSPTAVVLVVDDKRNMLSLMAKVLRNVALVVTADRGETAIDILAREMVDVVLCDLRMPDVDGLAVFRACRRLQPRAKFILMTAHATVETAVETLKHGAYDYLLKPFDPDYARGIVLGALHSRPPRSAMVEGDELLPGVHGRSGVMQEMASVVHTLAAIDASVVLVGESGVGKHRVATAIHGLSSRRSSPLVSVDCRTISLDALEEEQLSEPGSMISTAEGGTLFLDEIDAIPEPIQARLARVLEGLTSPGCPRIRVVAATKERLDAAVGRGAFRADLWFQLSRAVVTIAPLRSRPEDIPVLAAHLLESCPGNAETSSPEGFTAVAMEALVAFEWPGNVRQLKSVVERAYRAAQGAPIGIEHLPVELQTNVPSRPAWETMTWAEALARGRAEVAHQYLVAVLRRFDGDVVKAAAVADIERESFYRLLRRHGIQPEGLRQGEGEE